MSNNDLPVGITRILTAISRKIEKSEEPQNNSTSLTDMIPEVEYFKQYYDVNEELGKGIFEQFMNNSRIHNDYLETQAKNERSKIIIYYWLICLVAICILGALLISAYAVHEGLSFTAVLVITFPLSTLVWLIMRKITL